MVLTAWLCLFLFPGFGQTTINVDKVDGNPLSKHFYVVGGNPVNTAKYVKIVSGSPYFSENKMPGSLEAPDGGVVKGLMLRLDLVENLVLYSIGDGEELSATSPVSKVQLTDTALGKSYSFVHSSTIPVTDPAVEHGWYQVLLSGTASLYKKITKRINESRPYNSATYEQSIQSVSTYFILSKKSFTRLKKITAIPGLLSDKKETLAAYLKTNRFSGKTDDDYINLVRFYNDSLVGK